MKSMNENIPEKELSQILVLKQNEAFYNTVWYSIDIDNWLYCTESKVRSIHTLKPIPFQCYHGRSQRKEEILNATAQ